MVRLINISENRGDLLQNLSYTYDAVGNITKIAQSAGPVNGLGGNYQNSYIYDDLNRLQHSFCKTGLFDYDFNITMSPTGRIGEKNLTYAAGAISSYQLNGYDRNFTTHQPRVIYDQVRGSQSLFWDANGNLSQTVDCKTGAASINFWDEENRLRLAVNPKFVGYYGYDANGERVYKLTGSTQYDDLNGSNPSFGIIFDGLTVYPSPYIVLTEKQYTKHYYAGTEKIATMIGDGGLLLAANHISNEQRSLIKDGFYRSFEPTAFQYEKTPNIDIEGKYQSQLEYACGYIDQANLYLMSNFPMLEPMMQIWQNSNGCRNEIYYTHGDHLGSANWITDADGKPIQYIHYAPYGELIANKQTIGYDERYKFTGKERDWETGYDYFGARFYWSADGIFTTVDPLADKYPNVTPYLYCNGNPIMLVDPDGRNPIYDLDGNLIGTDEKGLQGSPIVMDSKLFTQGMSQEEAMGFDVGVDFLATEKKIVLQENYMRLSNRPDWDGRLNLFEANNWYRNGNGKPLFVDASKIDLSPLMKSDFSKIGSLYVNFLSLENLNLQTGLVYGTIKVSMINNEGMVRIGNQSGLLDVYNFDMQNGRGFRNFATILGSIVAGKGTSFNIYCYGQAKIK